MKRNVTLNWIVKPDKKYRQTTLAEYNRKNIKTETYGDTND